MKNHIEQITGESQYGFRPSRGTVDAILIVRQVMQKAKGKKSTSISILLILKLHSTQCGGRNSGGCLDLWELGRKHQTECAFVINGYITQ